MGGRCENEGGRDFGSIIQLFLEYDSGLGPESLRWRGHSLGLFSERDIYWLEQQRFDSNLHLGIFSVLLASVKCLSDVLPGSYGLMPTSASR